MVCSTVAEARRVVQALRQHFPRKLRQRESVLVYTGESSDDMKARAGSNVNEAWANALVVIYTSAIESGVSYTNPERPFARIYGYASHASIGPSSFLQMLHRSRFISHNEILVLLAPNLRMDWKVCDELPIHFVEARLAEPHYCATNHIYTANQVGVPCCIVRGSVQYPRRAAGPTRISGTAGQNSRRSARTSKWRHGS